MATALPPSSDFTGAAITEGNFKSAMTNLRAFLAGLLGTSGEQSAALAAMGALLNSGVSKSGAYTVVAADRGKVINCTGTWTLSVTAVATLGDGFQFAVFNSGVGTITIDPNLSEQINGATTLTVGAGQLVLIYCDGAKLVTVGGGGLLAITEYTANGTHTTNGACKKMVILGVGGGQAGGYADGDLTPSVGNGGWAAKLTVGVVASPASSYAVTIGAGGVGSTADGASGGDTTVGSVFTAYGAKKVGSFNQAVLGSAGEAGPFGPGGAFRATNGNGNSAAANTGAGGGTAYAVGSGTPTYSGGNGGSGKAIILEFA